MSDAEMRTHYQVQKLNDAYAAELDADRLENWPKFFTETCRYRITTRADYADDLPMGIIYADSRGMLIDRITSLRQANIFEDQFYRHIIGSPTIIENEGTRIRAETNFLVVRTMHTGDSIMFASGVYVDHIEVHQEGLKFTEKTVVLDSDKIDTLLVIPI